MGTAHYKPQLNSHNVAFGHCTLGALRPEWGLPRSSYQNGMLLLFLIIYLILNLAAAGLSCRLWDLCSSLQREDLSLGMKDLIP